ncbi:hypothetical protein [Allomuricauda sp. NBRC 101325]|uniref:hypothetical protein n=1 Tax=Allomuricauda sp. NBRC 101325 TaxID=1113758 RepID=UPI0024A3E368|nr:hypothetical protein [Muricauda sp. NBRC 101325]GLU43876.1 hypothetical protein Musp01_15000 [Muricauda sp. NBRC 101325]
MIKQNPFSLYDFLGYFVPGAILVYFYLILDFLENNENQFKLSRFLADTGNLKLDQILFFIIISYALGHLVNFISSITIEKYAIWKYDYPSKYLLNLKLKGYWANGLIRNSWRILMPIILFPIAKLDFILGDILQFKDFYTRKLDDFLIGLIKEKGQKLLNKLFTNESMNERINNNVEEYDFFRLFAHYTFEHSKSHQFKIVNYVALYGFLRVLSLITVIVFWFLFFSMIIKTIPFNIWVLFIVSIVSYIFFMAFMKFYRRYTLEGLMLIAINEEL